MLFDTYEDFNILKAVYGDDDLYLDEDGKHIVFRNVRGRIVPIHVDSSDYVDWLRDQGIPIDNTSQENMQQAEQILDYLDRVREVAGPEMAAKYETQVIDKYKEYFQQAQGLGYQQALEKKAQSKGMTSQDLTKQYKETYEQNKDNTIKASKDRTGEWSEFIGSYTEKMLNNSTTQDVASNEWGIVQAFDVALMIALDKAKKGEAPATLNLVDLLREEGKTRDASSRLFSERYDPKTGQEQSGVAAISLIDGIENIIFNVETSTPFGKSIETAFDNLYVRMFNDFDKPNQGKLSPMAGNMIPTENFDVPDELPTEFSSQEANRLIGMYKAQTGGKLGASHKVLLHTISRLWEQIPEDKRVAAYEALNDEEKGIHKLHKLNFIRAFQDTANDRVEYNPDRLVEESLRDALHVKDSRNYNEIVAAIKAITVKMSHLDGYYAYKNGDKSTANQKEVIGMWNNSPVLAGRAKSRGDGPNIMQFFSDDAARRGAMFPNNVLKVIHKGNMPATSATQEVDPAFNEQGTPEVAPTPNPAPTPAQPDNDIMGWRQERNKFIDDSTGTEVTMTPVTLPSGAVGLKLSIKDKSGKVIDVDKPIMSKGKSKEDVMREVIGIVKANSLVQGAGSPAPKAAPKPAVPSAPAPKSTPPSSTKTAPDETIKLHKEILAELAKSGYKLRQIHGDIYETRPSEQSEGNAPRVAIDKTGKVIISMPDPKVAGKYINQYASDVEEAKKIMGVASPLLKDDGNPDNGGVQTEAAMQALGDVDPGVANLLKDALTNAVEKGLTYRSLGSTKTVRIQNENDRSKGYISISNKDGTTKAHLIMPDGSVEEIPLEQLASKTAQLL